MLFFADFKEGFSVFDGEFNIFSVESNTLGFGSVENNREGGDFSHSVNYGIGKLVSLFGAFLSAVV